MSKLSVKLEIADGMTWGELRRFVELASGRPDDQEVKIVWDDQFDVPLADAFELEVEPTAIGNS